MHYNQLAKENEDRAIMLVEMDQNRDAFLVNTSHEIRNPLHGMINIAQSISDNNELSEESLESMKLLMDIGKRLNYTLNDLTVVTQLRDNRVTLERQHVNLHITAAVVLNMLEFMKEGKEITLLSSISTHFPTLHADESRLIQILFNLTHNALKFTEKGSVLLDATYKEGMATIYVKDTGVGISNDQHIDSIFQAYERGNNHSHTVSGIGIGLSVSKQLVEIHGGTITFESTQDGTTFMFTMPLAEEDRELPLPDGPTDAIEKEAATNDMTVEKDPTAYGTRPLLLLVDDDPINLKVLRQVLVNEYDIVTAGSGEEELTQIHKNCFDLVLSDVMIPHMSGYELTKKVRQSYALSELPILFITARNLPEDIHAAFASGSNDYLIKPVNLMELKTRVEALTSLKKSVKNLLRFEAAWLQAQIHPHFLFNTLNSIADLAEIDTNRMVALLEAFGDYLQKSFSMGNVAAEIPLHEELELTKAYVHIEKERFGDRICVAFDIHAAQDSLVPHLSIQPLVENAIMNGILEKKDGGTVTIHVQEQIECLQVTIQDDGVGMIEEKVNELLDLKHNFYDGVGVKNTNRRLTQLFGEGTIVSFQILAYNRNETNEISFP